VGGTSGPGFVYFIRADVDPPLIKIGVTHTSVERRFRALQTQNAARLTLIGYFAGHSWDEITLHRMFAEHRSHGEWFHAVPELVAVANQHADALNGDVFEVCDELETTLILERRVMAAKQQAKSRKLREREVKPDAEIGSARLPQYGHGRYGTMRTGRRDG
jgi:hypothetical protein